MPSAQALARPLGEALAPPLVATQYLLTGPRGPEVTNFTAAAREALVVAARSLAAEGPSAFGVGASGTPAHAPLSAVCRAFDVAPLRGAHADADAAVSRAAMLATAKSFGFEPVSDAGYEKASAARVALLATAKAFGFEPLPSLPEAVSSGDNRAVATPGAERVSCARQLVEAQTPARMPFGSSGCGTGIAAGVTVAPAAVAATVDTSTRMTGALGTDQTVVTLSIAAATVASSSHGSERSHCEQTAVSSLKTWRVPTEYDVLDYSISVGECPPPRPRPSDAEFASGLYAAPAHRVKTLERHNSHPLDATISFEERYHHYYVSACSGQDIRGVRVVRTSVTSVAGRYVPHFEPKRTIIDMLGGYQEKPWREPYPRRDYCAGLEDVPEDLPGACCSIVFRGRGVMLYCVNPDPVRAGGWLTLAVLTPEEVRAHAEVGADDVALREVVKNRWLQRDCGYLPKVSAQEYHFATFERGLTAEEIQAKWEANGQEASHRGTEAHLQMELFLNREHAREGDPENAIGRQFLREVLAPRGAKAYRTEWEIFASEENVAGSVDAVFRMPDGGLAVVDWKRSKGLRWNMHARFKRKDEKRCEPPLDHLDNADGAKYALQLNLYKYIIEKYYGERVVALVLVSLHPDVPFVTMVPSLPLEAGLLMAECRAETARSAEAERWARSSGRADLLCPISGQLLVRPVRCGDGRCYERGMLTRALLAGASEGQSWLAAVDVDVADEAILGEVKRLQRGCPHGPAAGAALGLGQLSPSQRAWLRPSRRCARDCWGSSMPLTWGRSS